MDACYPERKEHKHMLVHVRGFPRYAAAYNFYIFLGVTNLLLLLLLGDVAGVNTLRTADAHRADGTLVRHFHESPSSETTADLELLNDSRDGDELHLGHLRLESIVLLLGEKDLVVDLVTGLSLGPLLLLALAARHGRGHLLLLRLLLDFGRL